MDEFVLVATKIGDPKPAILGGSRPLGGPLMRGDQIGNVPPGIGAGNWPPPPKMLPNPGIEGGANDEGKLGLEPNRL